jgi:hypothetical protein
LTLKNVHVLVCMRSCVRSQICVRIRSKIGEHIPLYWLYAFYMRVDVHIIDVRAQHACARACTARMCAFAHMLDQFTPNLVEDSMGHGRLRGLLDVCLHAFVCARCVCVHAHARMRAFSHVVTDSLHTVVDTLICICALACAHNAHMCAVRHACVHSYILGRIRSNLGPCRFPVSSTY